MGRDSYFKTYEVARSTKINLYRNTISVFLIRHLVLLWDIKDTLNVGLNVLLRTCLLCSCTIF